MSEFQVMYSISQHLVTASAHIIHVIKSYIPRETKRYQTSQIVAELTIIVPSPYPW